METCKTCSAPLGVMGCGSCEAELCASCVGGHECSGCGDKDIPTLIPTLLEVEENHVRRVLEIAGGNKSRAAEMLGIDRRTLYRKLERYERSR